MHTDEMPNPHVFQNTIYDASGRRTGFYGSRKGRWGSILNMVTESKSGYEFDGDGRPVVEKEGFRYYHISDTPPPANWIPDAKTFQVWSTVLGSSLTTVNVNGGKLGTRIFAGGAVIATQSRSYADNQTFDYIGWTTADPVTGTTAKFDNYSGTTNFTKVEIEPLGQSIDQNDPEEPPQPPPNDPGPIGGADDPHWQCSLGAQFYGGFNGMPFHCQQKIFESTGTTLPWENEAEELIQKIVFLDSPLPGITDPSGNSPSNSTLAFALNSTAKKFASGGDEDIEEDTGPPVVIEIRVPKLLVIDFTDTGIVGADNGKNVALSEDNTKKVDDAIANLKIFKPSEDCQKNVIDKLTGLEFKLTDFQEYLGKGYNIYDITKSTVSVVGTLFTEKQAKDRSYTSANIISETFKDKPILEKNKPTGNVIRTNAYTSFTSPTFLTYIRPDALGDNNRNRAFLFHEALHGFLKNGRTDPDLQKAFFGEDTNTSKNITDYIKEHCFKEEK